VPDKAAIFRARRRLGAEPVRELLAQVGPVATEATPGAFWRGWRLMVVDGTTVEAADTPANDAEFGRPRNQRGKPVAYPMARVTVLAESGTHVVVDAAAGPYTCGEVTLAEALLRSLRPGMLLLADRGFPGVALWKKAAATGADLLWRVQSKWALAPEEVLADGSWLSTVRIRVVKGRPEKGRESIRVRVIEYRLQDPGRDAARHYRLVTTILDPRKAPARELAALYAERWEAETTLAEWKTAQIGSDHVLASKVPELVYQEIYAHLAVHAAVRAQMHRVATTLPDPLDPDRLSFTAALRAARRSVTRPTRSFPPDGTATGTSRIDQELREELNPVRRLRTVIRQVKRMLPKYPAWDPSRPRPPQPTKRPDQAVELVPAHQPTADP
jgi:hypothetical protein